MVVTNEAHAALPALSRKDFVSDQEVRWCPGCGDYSILAQTQRVMPDRPRLCPGLPPTTPPPAGLGLRQRTP